MVCHKEQGIAVFCVTLFTTCLCRGLLTKHYEQNAPHRDTLLN